MGALPTVKIKAENEGFIIINESDYDSDTMELVKVERVRKAPEMEDATVEEVRAAIEEMDEDNDDIWTADGSAKVDVLTTIIGQNVTAALRDEAQALINGEE